MLAITALSLGFALAQQPTSPIASPGQTIVSPTRSWDDLTPRTKTILSKRARMIFRLPDGMLCDASGFFDFVDATNKSTKLVDLTAPDKSNLIITERRKIGEKWVVDDTPLALAWDLVSGQRLGPKPPLFRGRWPESWAGPLNFAMIDETDRDCFTKNNDPAHYSVLTRRFEPALVEVELRPFGQQGWKSRIIAALPGPETLNRDHIRGAYLLWPDPTIVDPDTGESVLEEEQVGAGWSEGDPDAGPQINRALRLFRTYWDVCGPDEYRLTRTAAVTWQAQASGLSCRTVRYVPLDACRLTPEALFLAMRDDGYELVEWTWKRGPSDGSVAWSRREVSLEFQQPNKR